MENTSKKRWIVIAAAASILGAFMIYRAVRADPRLDEVRRQRAELRAKLKETTDPAEEKRLWKEFREATKDLTPAQRKALAAEARKKRDEEEERYLTLSAAEKAKWLDSQLNKMDAMQKKWQELASQGGGASAAGGAGQPAGNKWSNLTAEGKESRRKQMLDDSTPEQRARRDQIRKDLAARRQQRGNS